MSGQEYRCDGCHENKKLSLAFCKECHSASNNVARTPPRVVSEVQLQTIRDALEPITDKIYKLGVTSGRGGALWPDEETYIDDELFLDECVSAVVTVLEGKE